MTSLSTQMSTAQPLQSAAVLFKQNQGPEALITSVAPSSPNNLTEEQLKHVHEIMQQNDGSSSKAKDLEKPSPQIISDGPKADPKPITAFQKLPDAIFVQSIFPNLKLDEIRKIRPVSKTVESQAIRSLRFRGAVSWTDLKQFLQAGGDLTTLANVKAIVHEGYYEVTDDFIEKICHLPNLESIDLSNNVEITDRALITLGSHATKLTSCDVSGTSISKAGIEALAIGCKNLSRIKFENCYRLDDEAYKALGKHASELTNCDFSRTSITNAGVEAIASGCKKLSEITLSNCSKIDDGALIALGANASELTSCNVQNTYVSNKGVEKLAIGCKKLSQINLSDCDHIRDDALISLGTHASNLTNCDVSNNSLSNTGVEALAIGCQKLSQINLSGCSEIDDGALLALSKHSSELIDCDVGGTKMRVTSTGVGALAIHCKKLSKINLSCCWTIDDKALIALGAHASELTSCVVNKTNITNAGVIAIAKGCKKLSAINFSSCPRVNDEVLKTFEDYALALTRGFIPGTKITNEGAEGFNAKRKRRVLLGKN